MKKTLVAFCISLFLLSGAAFAGINYDEPASLLLFPYFSSDAGDDTVISVTNVNTNFQYNTATGKFFGDVFAHFFYVDGNDCDITNIKELLTPGDIFTIFVSEHNPAMNKGFLFVIAEDANTRQPIRWDGIDDRPNQQIDYVSGLIGDAIVANGLLNFLWSIPAIGIKADSSFSLGDFLDTIDDLAFGTEYESLPSDLFISSFVEQGFLNTVSTLVLVSPILSGSDLRYLFYNNDEVEYSQTDSFYCWEVEELDDIFNGADNLQGIPAVVPTGWVHLRFDENRPVLGMLIQAVMNANFSSARLLHHYGCDQTGHIGL